MSNIAELSGEETTSANTLYLMKRENPLTLAILLHITITVVLLYYKSLFIFFWGGGNESQLKEVSKIGQKFLLKSENFKLWTQKFYLDRHCGPRLRPLSKKKRGHSLLSPLWNKLFRKCMEFLERRMERLVHQKKIPAFKFKFNTTSSWHLKKLERGETRANTINKVVYTKCLWQNDGGRSRNAKAKGVDK